MTITAEQIYALNKMNSTANKVQLGTLIQNAESIVAAEIALADGKVLVGNGSGVAAAVTLSGDVTTSNAGVTAIASGVIVNADVNASAAIAYSKLALTGSLVNADVNASAAIAYSKLALTGSLVNADVNASAAIAYSKLALSNSIVAGDLTAGSVTLAKLAAGVTPSHVVKYAGTVNTIAAASQSLTVTGAVGTDIVMLTFKTNANSVALLSAAANTDAIDVVFSADPGVSAVYYQVLRAAA